MYIIGLTGGIASGKSTVSKMLAEVGAHIVDADEIARLIVEPGCPAWYDIVGCFGKGLLNEDQRLNRKALGDIIFKNQSAKIQLEQITHPRIKEEILQQVQKKEKEGISICFLDIPLLFEVNWTHLVNEVWVVYSSEEEQLKRLEVRDNINKTDAMCRISSQKSLIWKAEQADVVIDNSGDFAILKSKILELWQDLKNRIK